MPREGLLARALVELADTLVDDFDVVDLLTRLADGCVEVLDVGEAGIMLAAPEGVLRVVASSSEAMRLLELFELQADEGPCLDCYRTGEPIVNARIDGGDSRWPRFSQEATAAGFSSVHAFPMRLRGTVIGAVNMFNVGVTEMTPSDIAAAQAMADLATIALLQHQAAVQAKELNDQLAAALNSRIVIEQAKGVVAERLSVDMIEAFSRLRRYSRDHNALLVDVAGDVVSGRLRLEDLRPPVA